MNGPCAKQTTRATIIAPSGERWVGTNAVRNPQAVCPREVRGYKTGEGYHLCRDVCDQIGHAEHVACRKAGGMARGGTLYLEGHTYACAPCHSAMDQAGVTLIVGAPPQERAA